jgi:hypothetical protein
MVEPSVPPLDDFQLCRPRIGTRLLVCAVADYVERAVGWLCFACLA